MSHLGRWWMLAVLTVVALVVGVLPQAIAVPPAAASTEETPAGDVLDLPALPGSPAADDLPELPEGTTLPSTPLPEPIATALPAIPDEDPKLGTAIDKSGLEVVARSENTTTFETSDGRTVRRISQEPLNARRDDGSWTEVSTELQRTDEGWVVENHPLQPQFAGAADDADAVSISRGDHEVSFSLIGADAGDVEAPFWPWDEKDELAFRDVAPNTDLEYEVQKGAIKETVVLSAPSKTTSWSWMVDAGALTVELGDANTLELKDSAGKVVLTVPTPFAEDSSGKDGVRSPATVPLKVVLTPISSGQWRYTVSAPASWLRDGARVYPVRIDPTFMSGPSGRNAYKSDGSSFTGVMHMGNTREGNTNRFWRSIATFDYGAIPGNFIGAAQVGVGYAGVGTTSNQWGW